jgi:hypothetical protein
MLDLCKHGGHNVYGRPSAPNKGDIMKNMVIIPCGAAKLSHPAKAAELYTGSMFADALRTARSMTTDENIRILSAKHGLVRLDHVLDPYEMKMSDKGSVTGFRLVMQLVGLQFEGTIDALLPKQYLARMTSAANAANATVVNHFEGCAGIGYQKARLKQLRETKVKV